MHKMPDYINMKVESDQSSGQKNEDDQLPTERRHGRLIFLSFGLLCILQAILNVSLRLAGEESTGLDGNTTNPLPITDCQSLKTEYKEMSVQHSALEDSFEALTEEKDQLENKVNQVIAMKAEVEEEREWLRSRLMELELRTCQRCPAGWKEINSRCYFLSNKTKTWEDSRGDCLLKGADLVIINSEQEQMDLYRLDGDDELLFWIGLFDKERPGTFKWVDGSALTTPFWQPGQPDQGGPFIREDCVESYHRNPKFASWNDAPCEHKLRWMCEREMLSSCRFSHPVE